MVSYFNANKINYFNFNVYFDMDNMMVFLKIYSPNRNLVKIYVKLVIWS